MPPDANQAYREALVAARAAEEAREHPDLDPQAQETQKAVTTVRQALIGKEVEELPPERLAALLEIEREGHVYPLGLTEGQQLYAEGWQAVKGSRVQKAEEIDDACTDPTCPVCR